MTATASGKISLALGGAKKPPHPAATNGVKRPHAALQDHEEEESTHGKAQVVSHFDRAAGGAIDEARPVRDEGPLIIKPRANRDWKEAAKRNKRQKSAKPGQQPEDEVLSGVRGEDGKPEPSEPAYGLNVPKSKTQNGDATPNGHALNEEGVKEEAALDKDGDVPMPEKTDDERAVDALLGREEKVGLVLPALTEEEAFARDYRDAPDMATLEDYDRVPVEQFGAALLRGMGWRDGEGIGTQRGKKVEKTKIPERRPALLGIGAKEEAAVAQEMGTWGKAAKDRKGAPQQVYNPVLLRDRKTGELFTEKELEMKQAQDEREKYEMEFEREERRKEKERRRRDDEDDRHRDRDDGRRHRRREGDDDRDRRKHDKDEEYYRRKEKEKRRRERERDDSEHDRERSRRHDSDRERRRDRR